MDEKHREEALDFVENVFTVSEGAESGKLVRALVKEIRSKRFYLPELELIMVDEKGRYHWICNVFQISFRRKI